MISIGYFILSIGRNVGMMTDGGIGSPSSEGSKISPGSTVN